MLQSSERVNGNILTETQRYPVPVQTLGNTLFYFQLWPLKKKIKMATLGKV